MAAKSGSKSPSRGASVQPTKDMSVSVRKIDNGFIVCKSGLTPGGKYVSSETFSKTNPVKISK